MSGLNTDGKCTCLSRHGRLGSNPTVRISFDQRKFPEMVQSEEYYEGGVLNPD